MSDPSDDESASERILLVDDDPTNLRILHETLHGRGYRLLVAKSGEQALSIAAKARPTLVLLDIVMPGIDGFETLTRLKANPDTAHTAVIFLSALDESRDKVKGLELGAVDYIAKPFDADEVIARVETHLRILRLEHSLARKNRELEEANQRMQRDLEAASRVQQSFLPEALPDNAAARFACAYRPCEQLGGDSLNVFAFDERRVGLYVLDVCGHGVPSSLLAVTVARSLRLDGGARSPLTAASDHAPGGGPVSPADVAGQLNSLYPMDALSGLYFTLLYGVLDTDNGWFRYVSAGHPGPLVLRGDGTTAVHEVPGAPIGLLPDSYYEEQDLQLQAGDRIYLYTDGLSEERNARNEQFGEARMAAVIRAVRGASLSDSVAALVDEVVAWRDGAPMRDDVAIVAAEMLRR